jgi:hypothetical protein
LTLFAVEAAAMFALGATMSIPAAPSAWANPGEHLTAATTVNSRPMVQPEPEDNDRDRGRRIIRREDENRDEDRSRPRNLSQDDTALRVKVRQNHQSHSSSSSHGFSPRRCFHCEHRWHVRPIPQRRVVTSLPVTGRNTTATALGGTAAVLTGVGLLWLSSGRRKWVARPGAATGSAA